MRTVIIGAGRMGRRHMQVVRDMGFDLAGICDPNQEAVALAAQEHHVDPAARFDNALDMLERVRPECVVVSSTAPTHGEYTCAAAELGARFILCEKPMATSLAECDRMIAACMRTGAKLAVNHQQRFMPHYQFIKDTLSSAEFGGMSSVTVIAGNVGIAMNGTHYFEMFRYLTDDTTQDVTAWLTDTGSPNPRGAHYEDRAGAVRLRSAGGRRFYMDVSADQGHGLQVIFAGPFGQLIVDELSGATSWSFREQKYQELPTTRYAMPAIAGTRELPPTDTIVSTRSVLTALVEGDGAPSGQEGRLAVQALVAAYVSHETGHRTIRIDDPAVPVDRTFNWA